MGSTVQGEQGREYVLIVSFAPRRAQGDSLPKGTRACGLIGPRGLATVMARGMQ